MGPAGEQQRSAPGPQPTRGPASGTGPGEAVPVGAGGARASRGEVSAPGSGGGNPWEAVTPRNPSSRGRPASAPTPVETTGERTPTLTAQLRAVQPPDVARQALRELDILARELAAVPGGLARAGLARDQRRNMFETMSGYADLARIAWEAIAEERLEQTGAEPEYRQHAVDVARRLTRMQHLARAAMQAPTGERPPLLWRSRIAIAQSGLRTWQASLSVPADPLRMGEGLYALRGGLSLAMAGTFELLALRLLTGTALIAAPLLAVGLALALTPAAAAGQGTQAITLAIAALGAIVVWVLLLLLSRVARARIGSMLGAACFSRTWSPGNGRAGSPLAGILLRGWWLLVGIAGIMGTLAALALSIDQQIMANALTNGGSFIMLLGMIGQVGVRVLALPTLAVTVALAALSLPALALLAVRLAGELGGSLTWVSAARRYALGPSASALAFLSGGLFVAVAWVATGLGLQTTTLLSLEVGTQSFLLTARALVLFAALALPYLLLHELPYRVGIRRWRSGWLSELAMRRADLESHVRRLSAADPRSGAQDTSDENLRAMQYDMVLLEFYRAKDAEAREVSASAWAGRAAARACPGIGLCAGG